MKRRYLILTLGILLLGFLIAPARVLTQDEATPEAPQVAEEASTAGAARVSVIRGDVSTQRGDSGDWVATTVNTPVVPGDRIATGQNSSAEVQLDFANTLRLGQGAEAQIAELSRNRIQVEVAQGMVNFTVFKGTEAQVEILTPNMSVRPLGEGSYRIQVNSPTETQVIVRQGQAEVATDQGSITLERNKMILVQGADNPEYQMAEAPRLDGWDEWNRTRDKAILEASSWRYTDRYYTGAQDLDRYGQWVQDPDYDWCWTPRVDAGWVPYYDGRWTWEPYWGWTWVSYEPWGWAPYHYGRWFSRGGGWYWWPGRRGYGYRPAWGPAYVSFLGFGGRNWGAGVGFGFGSVGWLALGPHDSYRPWWGRHNGFNAVNINSYQDFGNRGWGNNRGGRPYVSNLQQAMNDPHVRRGITMGLAQDFANGRRSGWTHGVDSGMLRQGHVVSGRLPVVPTRASLRSVDRPAIRAGMPNSAASQRFFGQRQQSGGRPSFNQEAAQVRRMMQTHNQFGGTAPAGAQAPFRANPAGSGGFGRTPQGTGQTAQPGFRGAPGQTRQPTMQSGQSAAPGWQRFTGGSPAAGQRQGSASGPASNPRANRPAWGQSSAAPAVARQASEQSGSGGNRGGWQRFSESPRQALNYPSTFRQGSGAPAAQPNWGKSSPRTYGGMSAPRVPQGSTYQSAPRSYSRPPLQIQRSIVTERSAQAPRSYGGGGGGGGGGRGGGGGGGGGSRGGGGGGRSGGGHGGGGRR